MNKRTYKSFTKTWIERNQGSAFFSRSSSQYPAFSCLLLSSHPSLKYLRPLQRQDLSSALSSRLAGAYFKLFDHDTLIISYYAPQDNTALASSLLRELHSWLLNTLSPAQHLIIGGDWNCVLDTVLDCYPSLPPALSAPARSLQLLITALELQDVYRHIHPSKQEYTNRSRGTNRRLDRLYVSPQLLPLFSSAAVVTSECISTHHPVRFSLRSSEIPRGPGSWTFPITYIKDPKYRSILYPLIVSAIAEAGALQSVADYEHFIRILRRNLQKFTRAQRTVRKHFPHAQRAWNLESQRIHSKIPGGIHPDDSFAIYRRAQWTRRQALIDRLDFSNSDSVIGTTPILRKLREVFSSLYNEVDISDEEISSFLDSCPISALNASQRSHMDLPMTIEELETAAKRCNRNAAPGPNGLPMELFTHFPELLIPQVLRLATLSLSEGFFGSAGYTMIRLIPKKVLSPAFDHWRPLSLMNADLKIITQALNTRILSGISSLIHPDQTGFIPHRHMSRNIFNAKALLASSKLGACNLLSLDFSKAYDRVNRKYLFAVLTRMGFPKIIVSYIMVSLSAVKTRIIINGHFSRPFAYDCGVRQGDPVAPTLFALSLEPLLALLRRRIKGFSIDYKYQSFSGFNKYWNSHLPSNSSHQFQRAAAHRIQVNAFADDVLVYCSSYVDASRAAQTISEYCRASGAILSPTKCVILQVRTERNFFTEVPLLSHTPCKPLSLASDFKLLGVRLDANASEQWQEVLTSISKRLNAIYFFDLSLSAAVKVVNIYVLSKILFLDPFNPIPTRIRNAIKTAIIHSLRRGRRALPIRYNRLCLPSPNGGFGLWDIKLVLIGARAQTHFRFHREPSFGRSMVYGLIQERIYHNELAGQIQYAWFAELRRRFPQGRQGLPYSPRRYLHASMAYGGQLTDRFSPSSIGAISFAHHLFQATAELIHIRAPDNVQLIPRSQTDIPWFAPIILEQMREDAFHPEEQDRFSKMGHLRDAFPPYKPATKQSLHHSCDSLQTALWDPVSASWTFLLFPSAIFPSSPLITETWGKQAQIIWQQVTVLNYSDSLSRDHWQLLLLRKWSLAGRWSAEYRNASPYLRYREALCVFCREAEESEHHFLFSCPFILSLRTSLLPDIPSPPSSDTFLTFLTRGSATELVGRHRRLARFYGAIADLYRIHRYHVELAPRAAHNVIYHDFVNDWLFLRGTRFRTEQLTSRLSRR